MVLGHEPSGVVVKTGSAVSGVHPGDHFALEPALPCGHCEMCRRERGNLCENMRFMSSGGIPGFFQETVNLPAHNLIPVPKHVGLREATLVEPLAVALHSLTFAKIQPGETAVVFGTGPIGLLTIAALKMAGAGQIWAVEPVSTGAITTRKMMGANTVIYQTDPVREILAGTSNRGVDVAFDCAAGEDTANQCTPGALSRAGRFVSIPRSPCGSSSCRSTRLVCGRKRSPFTTFTVLTIRLKRRAISSRSNRNFLLRW